LGFLGSWPFWAEDTRFWALDSLGFPWILSSESRLFNGLRGKSRAKVFRAASSVALKCAGMGAYRRGHMEGPDCSSGELNSISDFRQ
jgi:hypothetical protein